MSLKPLRRAIGILMLVDGALSFASPTEYPRRLQFGNALIDDILDFLADNPVLTRRLAVGEMIIGMWLAVR